MKTMPEIRQHNFSKIVNSYQSQKVVADILETTPGYVNQLVHGGRSIGEKAARKLEKKLKLQPYQLDWDLDGTEDQKLHFDKCYQASSLSTGGNGHYPSYMDYPEDYRLSVIYACYDLINEGVFPNTEEIKMELFFKSADIVREFNKPSIEFIKEALKQKVFKNLKN